MVDTDELINSAIEARAALQQQRQNLSARRTQIAHELAGTPRRDRGRLAGLTAELSNLTAADRQLHSQQQAIQQDMALRAHSAFQNARLAGDAAKNYRDEQTATQAANIQSGVVQLQAKYPNRIYDPVQAQGFHSEMEKLTTDNAMGMRNKSTAALVREIADFHDKEREKAVSKAVTTIAGLGLNPNDFINRDRSKDFLTTGKTLAEANQPGAGGKGTKLGSEVGDYASFTVGNKQFLVKNDNFTRWNGILAQPQVGEVATVPSAANDYLPATTVTGTQQLPGGLKQTTFGSGGSAIGADSSTTEGAAMIENARAQGQARSDYLTQNPDAATVLGGATVTSGSNVLANFPANLAPGTNVPTPAAATRSSTLVQPYQAEASPATLPTGVQPNAPITPVQQIAAAPSTQPIAAAPAPQTRNVGGVTYAWNGTRWEPQ